MYLKTSSFIALRRDMSEERRLCETTFASLSVAGLEGEGRITPLVFLMSHFMVLGS